MNKILTASPTKEESVKKFRIVILITLTIILVLILAKCKPTEEGLNNKIQELKHQIKGLKQTINEYHGNIHDLSGTQAQLNKTIADLQSQENILKAINEGKSVKYILKLRLRQQHITLSPSKIIKDELNQLEFEMPVDKEFYDSARKGQKIVDKFREGSLLMEGSIGNWDITIISKRIQIKER